MLILIVRNGAWALVIDQYKLLLQNSTPVTSALQLAIAYEICMGRLTHVRKYFALAMYINILDQDFKFHTNF